MLTVVLDAGVFLFFVFFGLSMLIVLLVVYVLAGSWQAAKVLILYDKVYRDVITQLFNRRRFDEVQYDLQETGVEAADRVRYWSIDIRAHAVRLKPGVTLLCVSLLSE